MGSTGRELVLDVPLTNVAIAYRPEGMIADLIFPVVDNLPKQGGMYFKWDPADAFRIVPDLRAPGTEAKRLVRSVSSDTFWCPNYALKDNIPYEDIENADAPAVFVARQSRAEAILDTLHLGWEYRVAVKCTDSSYVGSYSVVASAWTDHANANPLEDMISAIKIQEDITGYRPNRGVLSGYAWHHFRNNANVIGRLFGDSTSTNKGRIVTRKNAADLLELDDLLVGGAYRNTAQEGQTMTLSQVWGDNAMVYYAPSQPRIDKPSYGYTLRWKKIMAMQAEVFQNNKAKAEEVQVGYYQDEKITASALSHLVTGVGSSQ